MQLISKSSISKIAAFCIISSQLSYAENYVSVEYLQYDESNARVSVSAPSITVSHDFGADYNLKVDVVHDAVSGATPSFLPDSSSGASENRVSDDYIYGLQKFDEGRNAASLLLTTRFANRDELYTGIDYSRESDFDSKTLSLDYLHYTDPSHNRTLSIGASYSSNEILVYDYDTASGASHKESSTSINIQAGVTEVIDKISSAKFSLFGIVDDGYLTNPHSLIVRDYISNKRLLTESRPDTRVAYGFGLKYIRLLRNDISYQVGYRFYDDDWDISSHTIENDIYYEMNKQFTFGLGLRYYTQSEASFYNSSKEYFTDQKDASSDERLSDFDAFTYKASVDFRQNNKLSYNLGAEFYKQSTDLEATILTVGIKYKY